MYLKKEYGPITDIEPPLNTDVYLKIGTFKVDAHGTILGERLIKVMLDGALRSGLRNIYITIYIKVCVLI